MKKVLSRLIILFILLAVMITAGTSYASRRESTNYHLQTDVVNQGGNSSSSTNYIMRRSSSGQHGSVGSSQSGNYSADQGHVYTINTKPSTPESLEQFQADGATPIPWPAGVTPTTTEVMRIVMSDPDPGDILTPQIEVVLSGEAFTDNENFEGDNYNYSGVDLSGEVDAVGMVPGSAYVWQARVRDEENYYSDWVTLGGNPDFIVGTSAAVTDEEGPEVIIKIAGLTIKDKDFIDKDTTFEIFISDDVSINASSLSVFFDDEVIEFSTASSSQTSMQVNINLINISEGNHVLRVEVSDLAGNETVKEITDLEVTYGPPRVEGSVLAYPTPAKKPEMVNIAYNLNKNASVTVLIYSLEGMVNKWSFAAGVVGGKAGYNVVPWNLKNMFGEYVGKGIYPVQIVIDGKAKGKGAVIVH
jgi:hypothetical protein